MGFMRLSRFGDASAGAFDPDAVLEEVRRSFPDAKQIPGDQLELSVERAAALGAADHVVRTLRRNQEDYGPAYVFEIPLDGGD